MDIYFEPRFKQAIEAVTFSILSGAFIIAKGIFILAGICVIHIGLATIAYRSAPKYWGPICLFIPGANVFFAFYYWSKCRKVVLTGFLLGLADVLLHLTQKYVLIPYFLG